MYAFADRDAVLILEYPGYGQRPGKLSRASFDAATREAYELLRTQFPAKPVCVATESLGSGTGSTLAKLPRAGNWMLWVKRVFAAVMLGMAEYYLIKMGQVFF